MTAYATKRWSTPRFDGAFHFHNGYSYNFCYKKYSVGSFQSQKSGSSLQKSFERRGFSPKRVSQNQHQQNQQQQSSFDSGLPYYIWIGAGGTLALVAVCTFSFVDYAPLTGRRRWIATSPEWERRMGDQEYQSLLKQFRGHVLPPTHRATQTVHRVGSRIAQASRDFATQYNVQHYPSDVPFTYTVVRSDMANAFVLPGNHVFVMTGLFDHVQDEDALAAVLGHEAAHNLARHAGEKVSNSFVVQILARLTLLLDPSGLLLTIFWPAASLFRELPNSRQQETEADQIGVHLSALACFDPRAAPRVFEHMKKKQQQQLPGNEKSQPLEFLSTHPSHDRRIAQFDEWLPSAMQTFHRDGDYCHVIRKGMKAARQQAAYQAMMRDQAQSPPQRPTSPL